MIRLKGIEKRYGKFQAVHPLDLEVPKGEVFGFLGPNGAGKTTTNRILAGVLPPTAGQVFIDDIENRLHTRQAVHLRKAHGPGISCLHWRHLQYGFQYGEESIR